MADIAPAPANVVPAADATIGSGVAFERCLPGKCVRVRDDGLIELSDATSDTKNNVDGIMVNDAYPGQVASFIREGDLGLGAVLTPATTYALSGNGEIAPDGDITTSTDYKSVVGVGTSTTNLRVQRINSGAQVP